MPDLEAVQLKMLAQCGISPSAIAELHEGIKCAITTFKGIAARMKEGLNGEGGVDVEKLDKLARSLKSVASGFNEVARLSSFAQGGPDQGPTVTEFRVRISFDGGLPAGYLPDGMKVIEGEVEDD